MNRHILLLSNAYWPSIGGIENSLRHLAQEAQAAGDEVTIMVSDLCVPADAPDRWDAEIDGVVVKRYPIAPFSSPWLKPLNLLVSNYRLLSLLRAYKQRCPEAIIIARFHFCAWMALWAGFTDIRYLVPSIIGNQSNCENAAGLIGKIKQRVFVTIHHLVQKNVLRRCRNYVFSRTMEAQCSELQAPMVRHSVLTKPGVDQGRFHAVSADEQARIRTQLDLPVNIPIAIFVGRFVRAKGVDLLLAAMSRIEQPLHMVLVGSGTEQQKYMELVQQWGLSSRVSIIPPTRTVEAYYSAADLFVMSSRYEPLGQTILEAFASGLPVVAFRAGHYQDETIDTATQELGMDDYIVYADQPTAVSLSQAIATLLVKRQSFDRGDISAMAHAKFCWKTLYQTLIA